MNHHRMHPVAVVLLALILGPYLLAVAAIAAVLWAICFVIAVIAGRWS